MSGVAKMSGFGMRWEPSAEGVWREVKMPEYTMTSEERPIKINEIFGPTVQGEGAAGGRHCLFVRVAECNLRCGWCDTAYTWAFDERTASKLEVPVVYNKAENLRVMSSAQVYGELRRLWDIEAMPTMVVISGGEPLMQSRGLAPLAARLTSHQNMIHVETAGTLIPTPEFDAHVAQYNVSPKLAHSGNRLELRQKPEVLKWFGACDRAWFKFVMRDPSDFGEIDDLVQLSGVDPHRVMVMPEGVTAEKNMEVAKTLVDGAVARGYGLSYRTHILLWKDVRGK
jgi:7-carboxy-7-deazaguanine synthase